MTSVDAKWKLGATSLLSVLLCVCSGYAQQTGGSGATLASEQAQEQPLPVTENSGAGGDRDDGAIYVRSLGGGMISLRPGAEAPAENGMEPVSTAASIRRYFIVGATASAGYSSTSNDALLMGNGTDAGTPVFAPYVGVIGSLRTGEYVLQYSPTVVVERFTGERAKVQAVHTFTGILKGAISRRLDWDFAINGSYGAQSARLLSPQLVSSVSQIPSPDMNSSLLTNFGLNQAQSQASLGLEWQKSRTQSIQIAASGSYFATLPDSNQLAPAGHSLSGTLAVNFSQSVSTNIRLGPYFNLTRLFTNPACSTYGGGLEVGMTTRRGLEINLGGGPQGASQGCGNPGYSAHGRISSSLRSSSQIYLSVDRQFSTVFGESGRWSDTVGLGITKSFRRTTLSTDSGFARAENGLGTPSTDGYFISGNCSHELTAIFSVGIGYRQAQFMSPVVGTTRTIVLSFAWHPNPMPFAR